MANPKKIKAFVSEIVPYGRRVYKVTFTNEKKFPRFKPGQFLHLALDPFDPTTGFWPESRVFSIAGVGDDSSTVTIIYSVKGIYTKRMEKELEIGLSVWIKAPFGEFIVPNFVKNGETAVLIAGGTGLAPFIPFISQMSILSPVKLFYGVHSPHLLLFYDELQKFSAAKNSSLHIFLEEDGNLELDRALYTKTIGLLAVPIILEKCVAGMNNLYFLSGPPGMIKRFQTELVSSGVEKEKVIIDDWS